MNEEGCKKFIWTKNTTQKLIELLKERPILWDVSSSEYKNRNKRASAVNEIAKILKTTTDEIKHKMHNLRCQYGNERRKELRIKSGQDERYKSKWEFFDSLKFLFNHYSNGSNDNTDLMSHLNEGAHFKATIIASTSENAWESGKSKNESTVKKRKKIQASKEEEDKAHQKHFEIINTTQIDEWATFGNFVAAELRSLEGAPDLRSKCKRDIQRILLEVADEYANRNAKAVTYI